MILERSIYGCVAVAFLAWTISSMRSGRSMFLYRATKQADDPLMFWLGIATTAFVAATFAWLAFQPLPIGELLRLKR